MLNEHEEEEGKASVCCMLHWRKDLSWTALSCGDMRDEIDEERIESRISRLNY